MTTSEGRGELPAFQLEVARLFFGLPASTGFLLAGGAALLAQHLTARPTEDLDFFTAPDRGHVPAARDALEAAARRRGWSTERIHDSDTFCRLVVRSADAAVLVDLAVNAPPDMPASETPAGPTLAPEELAGHKLLALFDRAAARDFADVYVLASRFGKDVLLARAAQIDAGFDTRVLADMIATLDRFTESEIPVTGGTSAAELRAFYATWRAELTALPGLRQAPADRGTAGQSMLNISQLIEQPGVSGPKSRRHPLASVHPTSITARATSGTTPLVARRREPVN